ncbi:MAG: hypothetical protein C5B58_12290 [Acidobacteria bacterium]|nr:MAG: hypothetical protein C5B58_12290 [Acidobacteriota bacterium]
MTKIKAGDRRNAFYAHDLSHEYLARQSSGRYPDVSRYLEAITAYLILHKNPASIDLQSLASRRLWYSQDRSWHVSLL